MAVKKLRAIFAFKRIAATGIENLKGMSIFVLKFNAVKMLKENAQLSQLILLRNKFGNDFQVEKKTLLLELKKQRKFKVSAFKKYHDVLLFLLAYPENKELYNLACSELQRLSDLLPSQSNLARQLYQFGICHTQCSGKFSYELIRWLKLAYKSQVQMDPIEVEDAKVISILNLVMPEISTEILQEGQVKWKSWLLGFRLKKSESLLEILLRIFGNSLLTPRLKELLWSDLDIYINLKLNEALPTRSTVLAIDYKLCYHKEIRKQFFTKQILNQKMVEFFLSNEQKQTLICSSRMALACYQRETDPITFADKHNCHYYQLANGVSLALFGLPPEKRQVIDSYIGYLAFKNGLPIAYGGGWIFADSCRIGINIFPAFRGGESALLFTQILSAYKNIFNLNRFTVDPYQIGKNNSEGIQSGAFWMYYRLGFRPLQKEYKKLAAQEFELLLNKHYKTSASTLKKLANSILEFHVNSPQKSISFDACNLSKIAQKNSSIFSISTQSPSIKKLFNSNRFSQNWIVLFDWKNCPKEKLKTILKAIEDLSKLKQSGDEWKYITALQNQSILIKELKTMVDTPKT